MKAKLPKVELCKLFNTLEGRGFSLNNLSVKLGYNRRTIYDWRRGKFAMPYDTYIKLLLLVEQAENDYNPNLIDEKEQRRAAGLIGGRAHWGKNGYIGTIEDKIKGGNASYALRKNLKDSIFTRREIIKPSKSEKLAEFIGICMGDGSITDYQIAIALNSRDDKDFIKYVYSLTTELFGIKPYIQQRTKSNCSVLIMSSKELVEYLINLGLPKGDKIKASLDIPKWIVQNNIYSLACIRGLFDTDGSVFLETHKIKTRTYSYPRWSFVSASLPLRNSVYSILKSQGFSAKIRMDRSVNLEHFADIRKYFIIVGTSNPKHSSRYESYGEVA